MFPKGPGRIQAPEGTENKLLKDQLWYELPCVQADGLQLDQRDVGLKATDFLLTMAKTQN